MLRHTVARCAVVLACMGAVEQAARAQGVPAPFYRVFFVDGTHVDAYGEWVQVGDRLVFSVAVDVDRDPPALHLSNVAVSRVDLAATERYRESLRASTYATTRGDADFDAMSATVAGLLTDAVHTENPQQKLALLERARAVVADWPARHFAYRADEVRQIQGLIDEAVTELRAATGATRFDLAFVADTMPMVSVPLAPRPTLRDAISQVLGLARSTDQPAERISLLQAAHESMARATRAGGNGPALDDLATEVERALEAEVRARGAYDSLRRRALRSGERAAARADVRGVERAIARARQRDERLSGQRPDVMQDVLAALERHLESARRLRLMRDRWKARRPVLDAYRDRARPVLRTFNRARSALDDVRTLAGPSVDTLESLDARLREADGRLRQGDVPDEVKGAHAVLMSALQLASNAVRLRRESVAGADVQRARDASAAAAGALMMGARARVDIERALSAPVLP